MKIIEKTIAYSPPQLYSKIDGIKSIDGTEAEGWLISVGGMYKAIGFEKRNENYPQLTDHYFTGDYPVKPIDELGDNKITQLSLLNTASNN